MQTGATLAWQESLLNEHVHFHVCVVDDVFEATESGVIFHSATGIDADALHKAQATLCKRILRAFVGRGLLESFDVKEMLAYQHSGFSVDVGVRIDAHDRAGLERQPSQALSRSQASAESDTATQFDRSSYGC